jgi:hypothetical protein
MTSPPTEPKRKRGGQPKPPEERLIGGSVRFTAAQWAKIDVIGLQRVRRWLDRVKP